MTNSLRLPGRLLSGWAATFALLALLAGQVSAQETTRTTSRATASKYAAKQVRLPAEQPVVTKTAAKPRPAINDRQVRPTQHAEQFHGPHSAISGRSMRSQQPQVASRIMRSRVMQDATIEGDMMEEGTMVEEVPTPEGEMHWEHGELVNHDGGCEDGSCCGGRGCNTCAPNCCLIPCPRLNFDNFEFFAGTQGFTGPATRGQGGSFGFHEGLNWANCMRLPCHQEGFLSAQLGFQATQSSLSGSDITDEQRRQFFITGGFFRRADWGLQGGLVFDHMHDEWYYDAIDLSQVRGEISWVFPQCHELGFWFAQGISNTTSISQIQTSPAVTTTLTEGWHPTDLYAFFYRRRFDDCNSTGRVFGGFTGEKDGLIGADFNLPLTERWALRSEFTYLIPTENRSNFGNSEESWNVGLTLVWYPGCRTARNHDYNRPLFNVANNGTFMVDRN